MLDTLKNPEEGITKRIVFFMNKDEHFRVHFGHLAYEKCKEFNDSMHYLTPLLVIPR